MILTQHDKNNYWKQVQAALEIVGARPELAHELLTDVNNLPERQQELFYHAEPIDIARDLSGIEQWTDQQIRIYVEMQAVQTAGKWSEVFEPSPIRSSELEEKIIRLTFLDEIERELISRALARDQESREKAIRSISRVAVKLETNNIRRALTIIELLALVALMLGISFLALGLFTAAVTTTIASLLSIVSVVAHALFTKYGIVRTVGEGKTDERQANLE